MLPAVLQGFDVIMLANQVRLSFAHLTRHHPPLLYLASTTTP